MQRCRELYKVTSIYLHQNSSSRGRIYYKPYQVELHLRKEYLRSNMHRIVNGVLLEDHALEFFFK